MTPPKPRGKRIKGLSRTIGAAEAARLALDVRMRDVERLLAEATDAGDQDAKAIHRLRVSTRRAAAALRSFKAWTPKRERKRAQSQLREIRGIAGEARMCDVQLEQFRQLLGRSAEALRPAIGVVIGRIIESRRHAGAGVRALAKDRELGMAALDRSRRALAESIGSSKCAASDDPTLRSATLMDVASAQVPDLVGAMADGGRADLTVVDHVHALRISGKRLRYAAEIFESCFDPEPHDALLERLTDFQDHLGEMNDLWEMGLRVERYAGDAPDDEIGEALARLKLDLSGRFDRAHRAFLEWWGTHGMDSILAGLDLPGRPAGDATGAPAVVRPGRSTDRIIESTTPFSA